MRTEPSFYIGWQQKAPADIARAVRRFLYLLFPVTALFAGLVVFFQKHISESVFEFGQTSELAGILTYKPVPMLVLPENGKRILLVSVGKFGAEKSISTIFGEKNTPAEGQAVKVSGYLIYYDGKTALEMHSMQPVTEPVFKNNGLVPQPAILGNVTLKGEITDPKCFLGVMKPGHGKPHQDCAARCISGGIPPMLKVANAAGETEYYLLKGPNGESINQQVLPFVGSGVQMSGALQQWGEWLVMNMDISTLQAIHTYNLNPAPMCN